jgi:hypothetical protein
LFWILQRSKKAEVRRQKEAPHFSAGVVGRRQKAEVIRILILILGVVAGLGHVALGKRRKGLILFALFVTFANIALVGRVILEGPYKKELFIAGVTGACLIWLISYVTLILSLFRRRGQQNA